MNVAIDTCSLLSLVRYYLPFDKNLILMNLIKDKILEGEIIIIDKVLEESRYVSNGLILEKMPFLNDKIFLKLAKCPYKTDSLLAPSPRKFLSMLDNNWVIGVQKNKISSVEYENRKSNFLIDADMKLIITCLNFVKEGIEIHLVTEESESTNDNKLFKKIPTICNDLNISVLTLPELLEIYDGVKIRFH